MLNHTAEPLKSLAVGAARAQPSVCVGWTVVVVLGGGGEGRLGVQKNLAGNTTDEKERYGERPDMCKVAFNTCVICISGFQQVAP